MRAVVQDSRHPSQILFAFDELVVPAITELRWAVAYTTRGGAKRVVERIIGRIGSSRWRSATKALVTCFDFGHTDPDGLEYLRDEHNITIRIANPGVIETPNFRPLNSFHPKIYMCKGSSVSALVGSANLTDSAMIGNTEGAVLFDKVSNDLWEGAWNQFIEDSVELVPSLLTKYREARNSENRQRENLDDSPPAVTVSARNFPVFWEAITAGKLAPMEFNHFWIEAGSMSSGGSRSQLESPRGANRFFGFAFNDYGNQHATIGFPIITAVTKRWTGRPLTWHGDNRMERLNLPTVAQGGFVYARTAILFRRHAGGFELEVAPWNDALALSWRNASYLLGRIYRLGASSNRACGLF